MHQTQTARSFALAALALTLPMALLADINQTTTLAANSNLNFDSGATGSSGGDIRFTGASITLVGMAGVFNFGQTGLAGYNGVTQATLALLPTQLFNQVPLSGGSLVVNDVFAVLTNGGNYAKVLITALSGSSITLQFVTFGASGGGGGGPTITQIVNNSSSIPAGFPNSGIAPSSLFAIKGTGLADPGDATLHSSQGAGLQLTVNGASISVTINGTTTHPAMYYATPTQLSAVLPAATPVGTGTLTVTYKGVPSAPFTIVVVANAPGITTYLNGTGVAQDVNRINDPDAGLITFTKSGVPGQGIILWGTGLGADPLDSDTTFTLNAHQTSVPYTVYIGGIPATIGYQGASVYPGVSVFGLFIPQNVPTGCYVPIVAVTGNVVSNIVTLPIHAGGGVCSDPQLGIAGDRLSTLTQQTTVKTGTLIVSQSTAPGTGGAPTTTNGAFGLFAQTSGAAYAGGSAISIGGCILIQTLSGGGGGLPTGLDAGAINVTGPSGGPVVLTTIAGFPGFYNAVLSTIPATGGAFVFNGAGGTQIGGFTATVNFPNPLLSWTNQVAAATVNRSQGFSVTWSGGTAGSYVLISGSSTSGSAIGNYTCLAPQSAGQFTVPSWVLLGMPAGTGTTMVQNSTNFTAFSASGLDRGAALGSVSFSVNSSYN